MNFFIRFWHIVLKISIFCKKIITFSSSAHLMKKSTFLPKFQFFLHKIDIFAPELILTETLVTLPQSLHDIILSLCLEIHSFPKNWRFWHKMLFLLKENNATKNWHFSKIEDTSLRKLNISFNNWHIWKWWPFATKIKKSFKIGVSARFSILPVKLT